MCLDVRRHSSIRASLSDSGRGGKDRDTLQIWTELEFPRRQVARFSKHTNRPITSGLNWCTKHKRGFWVMRLLCRGDRRATSGEEGVILAPEVLEAGANLNVRMWGPDRVDISK